MRNIAHKNSAIGIRLNEFGLALKASPPLLSRARQLIFLCGANQAANTPSVRRASLKSFIHKISNTSTVIYAEGIFNELRKFGSQKNALDLEHRISEVADKVIIILESESAFCELGAFAHEALRDKLIVINNSQFKTSESFINTGPIAAVLEAKAPVLWYPMAKDGVYAKDGIGAVFAELAVALEHKHLPGRVKYETLSSFGMNKISLYFIHDLVMLSGPVSHLELITLLKAIFGEKNFDSVKSLLGVLREGQLVSTREVGGVWVYHSISNEFFLRYESDVDGLMAAFRVHHLRNSLNRFK